MEPTGQSLSGKTSRSLYDSHVVITWWYFCSSTGQLISSCDLWRLGKMGLQQVLVICPSSVCLRTGLETLVSCTIADISTFYYMWRLIGHLLGYIKIWNHRSKKVCYRKGKRRWRRPQSGVIVIGGLFIRSLFFQILKEWSNLFHIQVWKE